MHSNFERDVTGDIPNIIENKRGLYIGDLKHYFRVLFRKSRNWANPYHNISHIGHVLWRCYTACVFYAVEHQLTKRERRNLLIAAIFHDFNHTGKVGNDQMNIRRALRALDTYLLPEDRPYRNQIARLIEATEYPYTIPHKKLSLSALILRDADMGQVFSHTWLQQVVGGLAHEWKVTPLKALKREKIFLESLSFHTEWAQWQFPKEVILAKIREVERYLAALEPEKKKV